MHYMEVTVVGDQSYQFPADILRHICRWEMSSDSLNSSLFGWLTRLCQKSGEGLTADVSDATYDSKWLSNRLQPIVVVKVFCSYIAALSTI